MRPPFALASASILAAACSGPIGTGSAGAGRHSLHITVTGQGSVRSAAIGADCAIDCRVSLQSGQAVHLEAVAQNGTSFVGWTGACSGTAACDLTLSADAEVGAKFVGGPPTDPVPPASPPAVVSVHVEFGGDGQGSIDGTIHCDTTCSRTPFSAGERVVLTASPEPGSQFTGWGGPCGGSGECRFLIQQDTTVFVNFSKSVPPPPPPPPARPGPQYSVVKLSDVVGGGSQPVAMNAGGQVLGNGPGGPWIYDSSNGSVRKVLPTSETRNFVANGISASGDVALDLVGKDASGKPTHHAFRFSQGKLVDLGSLGGAFSTAKVINSTGVVAGDATLPDGAFRAFLFDGNGLHNLGTFGGHDSMAFAINEKGWVTGTAERSSGPWPAFRYDGSMHDLGTLGGNFAQGQAINESGQVAGWSTLDPAHDEPVHAFFHDGTSMRDLGVLPNLPWSSATGLNNHGIVVGNVYAEVNEEDYDTHAFVFRDGKMWDLNEQIPASPFKLFTSLSVDDSGRILCTDGQVGQAVANGYLLVPE